MSETIDYNAGFAEIDSRRTDFTDPELGNERLFTIPGMTEHLGGLGMLMANLDTLEEVGD